MQPVNNQGQHLFNIETKTSIQKYNEMIKNIVKDIGTGKKAPLKIIDLNKYR
jgi:hypothetical protein